MSSSFGPSYTDGRRIEGEPEDYQQGAALSKLAALPQIHRLYPAASNSRKLITLSLVSLYLCVIPNLLAPEIAWYAARSGGGG